MQSMESFDKLPNKSRQLLLYNLPNSVSKIGLIVRKDLGEGLHL